MGDFDNDGVGDILVGARQDDDGSVNSGAVYLLFLTWSGTVKSFQKLSNFDGELGFTIDSGFLFGSAVTYLGDFDNDGNRDIAVGAQKDDELGTWAGAVYVLSLASLPASTSAPTVPVPAPTAPPVPAPTASPR